MGTLFAAAAATFLLMPLGPPPAGPGVTGGTQVQVRATPANGGMVQNWSQDLNGSQATQSLTISRKHTVTATFVQRTSFDLFLPVAIR